MPVHFGRSRNRMLGQFRRRNRNRNRISVGLYMGIGNGTEAHDAKVSRDWLSESVIAVRSSLTKLKTCDRQTVLI